MLGLAFQNLGSRLNHQNSRPRHGQQKTAGETQNGYQYSKALPHLPATDGSGFASRVAIENGLGKHAMPCKNHDPGDMQLVSCSSFLEPHGRRVWLTSVSINAAPTWHQAPNSSHCS